jgi:hypothetical protein
VESQGVRQQRSPTRPCPRHRKASRLGESHSHNTVLGSACHRTQRRPCDCTKGTLASPGPLRVSADPAGTPREVTARPKRTAVRDDQAVIL